MAKRGADTLGLDGHFAKRKKDAGQMRSKLQHLMQLLATVAEQG